MQIRTKGRPTHRSGVLCAPRTGLGAMQEHTAIWGSAAQAAPITLNLSVGGMIFPILQAHPLCWQSKQCNLSNARTSIT